MHNGVAFVFQFPQELYFLLFVAATGFAFDAFVVDQIAHHLDVLFAVFVVHLVPVLGHLAVVVFPQPQHHLLHLLHQSFLCLDLLLERVQALRTDVHYLFGDLLAVAVDATVYFMIVVL